MANQNDIEDSIRELSRVLGVVFYVTTNISKTSPEYYPLWVAVNHGMNTVEELAKHVGMTRSDDEGIH